MNDDREALLRTAAQALFRMVAEAVSAEGPTPSIDHLHAELVRHGCKLGRGSVGTLLSRLRAQRRIDWSMAGRHRRYFLPGDARRTRTPGEAADGWRLARDKACSASSGWPRPTRESVAFYDAAMELKPFASQNVFPRSRASGKS